MLSYFLIDRCTTFIKFWNIKFNTSFLFLIFIPFEKSKTSKKYFYGFGNCGCILKNSYQKRMIFFVSTRYFYNKYGCIYNIVIFHKGICFCFGMCSMVKWAMAKNIKSNWHFYSLILTLYCNDLKFPSMIEFGKCAKMCIVFRCWLFGQETSGEGIC